MRSSLFNRIIIGIVLFCLVSLVLEGLARLVVADDLLGKVITVLQQDSELFWRQKPGIKLIFQDVEVCTDRLGLRNKHYSFLKSSGALRIVCLGASPTFGWGVGYEDTYPRRLEKLLRRDFGEKIEVINAGVIGYSSFQGLALLKKSIIKLRPDVITVSYELNDIDKHRFFRSNGKPDKELLPLNYFVIELRNLFNKSKFVMALERLAFNLCQAKYRILANRDFYYPENVRVSLEDYRHNLQSIIDFAKVKGVKVIFIKFPVNLPLPSEIAESSRIEAESFVVLGLDYAKSKRYDEAARFIKKAIDSNPYSSKAFYYLGILYEKKGRFDKAKDSFEMAKKNEAFRCAIDGRLYNSILEEVARKNAVPFVDIVSAFKQDKRQLFLVLKRDSIHPNAMGHQVISNCLYDALLKNNILSQSN